MCWHCIWYEFNKSKVEPRSALEKHCREHTGRFKESGVLKRKTNDT